MSLKSRPAWLRRLLKGVPESAAAQIVAEFEAAKRQRTIRSEPGYFSALVASWRDGGFTPTALEVEQQQRQQQVEVTERQAAIARHHAADLAAADRRAAEELAVIAEREAAGEKVLPAVQRLREMARRAGVNVL